MNPYEPPQETPEAKWNLPFWFDFGFVCGALATGGTMLLLYYVDQWWRFE